MKDFKGIYYLHGSLNKAIEDILHSIYKHREFEIPASPKLDVIVNKHFIDIYADMPGVDINDFKVYLVDRKLIIEGVKKMYKHHQKVNYILMEREFFPFRKIIELPYDVNYENGFAKLKDGVLHIRLERHGYENY